MEDPRAELRTLLRAARALAEYAREASPEGAMASIAPTKEPPKAKKVTASADSGVSDRPAPELKPAPRPVAAAPMVSAPAVVEAAVIAPSTSSVAAPITSLPEAAAPGGPVGFRDLFAALDPAPPTRAAPQKVEAAPKPEAPKGPLGKAKLPEISLEDQRKRDEKLEEIAVIARVCEKCRLCERRRSVVWGVGPALAPLMLIGEGPGENEDLKGVPFVGAAGQLLTKIIEATGFSREDVYIANVVKCRPPNNRTPEPDEVAACWPYLEKQIELVSPKVIVILGKSAAQALLKTSAPISRLRGTVTKVNNTPCIPTYHPAYLLRNPGDKRLVWDDMRVVRRVYDEIVG